jgi:hypothetical protein
MQRFEIKLGDFAVIQTARNEYEGFITYISPSRQSADIFAVCSDNSGLHTIAASKVIKTRRPLVRE